MPSRLPKLLEGTLYSDMLRIRMIEEKIAELYSEQEMRCPVHLSIGQEGVAVGVCAALGKEDMVMSGHRAHAHYLAKGGSLKRMIAEIYGKSTGSSGGRGGSMHLIDLDANFLGSTPIVGGTIPIAVGVAWANAMKKQKSVSVLFHGEAAMEEGVWHESMNFAALHSLPVLFVCENNMYSVYTPLEQRQPKRSRVNLARAHGWYGDTGDGNNPLEVYKKTVKALKYIRSGKGPAFIEFDTYRWREHCGPNYDNALGYRTEEEFKAWQKKDPLKNVGTFIDEDTVRKAIDREILEAFEFAKQSPFAKRADVFVNNAYAS